MGFRDEYAKKQAALAAQGGALATPAATTAAAPTVPPPAKKGFGRKAEPAPAAPAPVAATPAPTPAEIPAEIAEKSPANDNATPAEKKSRASTYTSKDVPIGILAKGLLARVTAELADGNEARARQIVLVMFD